MPQMTIPTRIGFRSFVRVTTRQLKGSLFITREFQVNSSFTREGSKERAKGGKGRVLKMGVKEGQRGVRGRAEGSKGRAELR